MNKHRRAVGQRTVWARMGALVLSGGLMMAGTARAADDFTTPQPTPQQAAPSAPSQGQGGPAPQGNGSPNLNAPGTSRLGKEFVALGQPVRTGSTGIEVIEFFSYGCIACARTDALMQQWAQGLPSFVHFSASPAAGASAEWLYAARIFYTLDSMNVEQRLRQELFRAITQDGLKYGNMQVLGIWLDAHGINAKAFMQAFDTNLVIAKTGNLPNVMRLYQIQGVPAVIVDGHYLVTAASAGGVDKLPGVVGDAVNQAIRDHRAQGE